jgi:hypothetical protein
VYDPRVVLVVSGSGLQWMKKELTIEANEILQQRPVGQEKSSSALLGALNLVLHGVTTPDLQAETPRGEYPTGKWRYDVVYQSWFGGTEGNI